MKQICNFNSSTSMLAQASAKKSIGMMAFFAAALMLYAVDANAAGGLSQMTSEAKEWDKAAYTFIGACATIYLLIKGFLIWMNKGSWGDFGEACLKVVVVAAIPSLGVYLWGIWGS